MNKLKNNASSIAFILLLSYCLLIAYLLYNVTMYSNRWFARPSNPRINNVERVERMIPGMIADRNGEPIVWSEAVNDTNYERRYHDDITAIAPLIGMNQSKYGRTGLEAFYVKYLYGFNDSSYEKLKQALSDKRPVGNNVWLTIDFDLQKYAYNSLKGEKGAMVVMRADTGEILAMVSSPSYRPNNDETVQKDELVNRATEGLYPPGSVMKLVTALAAIQNPELLQEKYECQGTVVFNGESIPCYGKKVHGILSIEEAFIVSCNTTFSKIANDLGTEVLKNQAEKLGFNKEFLFSDIRVNKSAFPTDKTLPSNRLAWSSIGQDNVLVTPMHMAMIVSGIANNGVIPEPGLVYQVTGNNERVMQKYKPFKYIDAFKPEVATTLKEMMAKVVNEGTGHNAMIDTIQVYGKTGTAEVGDGDKDGFNDAWFVGFAGEKSPIVITVVIEETNKTGGGVAAPIAKKVLEQALQLQE